MGLSIFDFEDGKCYRCHSNNYVYRILDDDMYGKQYQYYHLTNQRFVECNGLFNAFINESFTEVPDPTIKMVTLEIPEDVLELLKKNGCSACIYKEERCLNSLCSEGRAKFIEQFIKKDPQ
jgi:hypothetical protein